MINGYKELRYLAYHDSLTGLFNRNWLYKNIDNISAKYVYFIDIHDLHKINEDGHSCGDEHIKMVIKSIILTGSDTLVRYAGDEFILLSNNKDVIKTNKLFAVGVSAVEGSLLKAINIADSEMITSKKIYKSSYNCC